MDSKKTYYNDLHGNPEVIEHRDNVYIAQLKKLQKRMKVWKWLTEDEEEEYFKKKRMVPNERSDARWRKS